MREISGKSFRGENIHAQIIVFNARSKEEGKKNLLFGQIERITTKGRVVGGGKIKYFSCMNFRLSDCLVILNSDELSIRERTFWTGLAFATTPAKIRSEKWNRVPFLEFLLRWIFHRFDRTKHFIHRGDGRQCTNNFTRVQNYFHAVVFFCLVFYPLLTMLRVTINRCTYRLFIHVRSIDSM